MYFAVKFVIFYEKLKNVFNKFSVYHAESKEDLIEFGTEELYENYIEIY